MYRYLNFIFEQVIALLVIEIIASESYLYCEKYFATNEYCAVAIPCI